MTGRDACDDSAPALGVAANLFILAPNNSGSTFLARALGRSSGALSLPREGQHVAGFHGPSTRGTGTRLLWAADPGAIAMFRDPAAFDWTRTQRAWRFHAEAASPTASILVVASPPFVLYADQLRAHFPDAKFLIMVRNPYAVVEGICRRSDPGPIARNEDRRVIAARHVATAMRFQRDNIAALADRSAFFTYEAMCDTPGAVEHAIAKLVPALGDVTLDQRIPVKSLYDEPLRNMNADQIARLSRDDVAAINSVFASHHELLEGFGYRLIEG